MISLTAVPALLVIYQLNIRLGGKPLTPHQEAMVREAIATLRELGFAEEAAYLSQRDFKRRDSLFLAALRALHYEDAYASTAPASNIITLYPLFFGEASTPEQQVLGPARDRHQRAYVLFHEYFHAASRPFNASEEEAHRKSWSQNEKFRPNNYWDNFWTTVYAAAVSYRAE